MKSTKKEGNNKASEYPCLKENSAGLVVLFSSKGTGTVVYAPNSTEFKIGELPGGWLESFFGEYVGQLILEN